MGRPVLHLHRYIRRGERTLNTTRCGRVSNAAADFNVTAVEAEVTCKFCLATLAAIAARGQPPLVRVQMSSTPRNGDTP
jgi:hypothetical protein